MNSDLESILDACIDRLRAGESIEACLADFPQHAEELRSLLVVAEELHQLPPLRARTEAYEAGREQMLAAVRGWKEAASVRATFNEGHKRRGLQWVFPRFSSASARALGTAIMAVLVLFVLVSPLMLVVAADSLPGDMLYPLKRSSETVRLLLATGEEQRQQLEQELAEERRSELVDLARQGRNEPVSVTGVLEDAGGPNWSINGVQFQITSETEVDGNLGPNQVAQVEVRLEEDLTPVAVSIQVAKQPPGLLARAIPGLRPHDEPATGTATVVAPGGSEMRETREPEQTAIVPGAAIMSVTPEQTVPVPALASSTPQINYPPSFPLGPSPTPTPHVLAAGSREPGPRWTPSPTSQANRGVEPTPSATPRRRATATRAATSTPTRTVPPLATAESSPTPSPTASRTPLPTDTAAPEPEDTNTPVATETSTRTVTLTPTRTETPLPTATATETMTPTKTSSPMPTDTQTPVPTETASPVPTATKTETPTRTPSPVPTATDTPVPTETPSPVPTATNTRVPTETPSPEPTATDTPVPTETPSPVPTATDTPVPTETPSPEPTPTDTPVPEPTATPEITDGTGREALPADLPVHPNPIEESFTVTPGSISGFQLIAEPIPFVRNYFRDAMRDAGWEPTVDPEPEVPAVVIWQKDSRICQINFGESESNTSARWDCTEIVQ